MKHSICSSIILSSLVGSLMLFGAGCGKKTVIPPSAEVSAGASMSGGTDINYPPAEGGYSEENLPSDGNLDDTFVSDTTGGIGAQSAIAPEDQTDEYKDIHGRSSIGLLPIYFEFDQAGISGQMSDIMIGNAQYLNSIPGTFIVIEGNSDERGTNEYNLALGERRAINTKEYLINLGVDPDRMRTLSYGEEKPLFMGQDDGSYSKNRRADFVVN